MAVKAGCIFCDIGQGKSPANLEYQDNKVVAFWDIQPKAPVHLMVVPKDHIESLRETTDQHTDLLGWMILVAKRLAEKKNLTDDGYRLIINTGRHSGAVVEHLHLHILGGKQLGAMG